MLYCIYPTFRRDRSYLSLYLCIGVEIRNINEDIGVLLTLP